MSATRSTPTPVVVLGSGHHGGLAIARSLGRLGVPVFAVDTCWWETAVSSRYCRGRFLLDLYDDRTDSSLDRMLEIGRKIGGRPVLIPVTDAGTIWVAEHAASLAETFRFTILDAHLVRTLCDKSSMQKLAESCGIPVAHSLTPHCRESLELFSRDAAFPLVVKATDAERLRARAGGTKFIVHHRTDLLELFDRAWDGQSPNFLVQEFIPGEDWMFDGFFDDDSQCRFGITAKKIRRFPPKTGVTSLGVCLLDEEVHYLTRKFMAAVGYRGILDIGYRYDLRDGRYKVMDVNPRIGSSFRLFTARCGLDVAQALYLHLTGSPVPISSGVEGRKWITEDFDLFSGIRSLWDGETSLKDWAGSLKGIHEAACFALDDPLPCCMIAVSDCCELWKWMRRGKAGQRHAAQAERSAVMAISRRR